MNVVWQPQGNPTGFEQRHQLVLGISSYKLRHFVEWSTHFIAYFGRPNTGLISS
jgi:hypothetical protein